MKNLHSIKIGDTVASLITKLGCPLAVTGNGVIKEYFYFNDHYVASFFILDSQIINIDKKERNNK